MRSADAATMDGEAWNRLLDRTRAADREAAASLYGPILAARAAGAGFVIGRLAQSLDGRIATPAGGSFWISGPADVLHTHRLRALCDAVIVGARTVSADDPRLTTRACSGPSPVRVVLDRERRLDPGHRIFDAEARTLLLCADDTTGPGRHGTADVVPLPRGGDGRLDPACIIEALARHGLRLVCVEGGGRTVSRFLAAGALDRLHVTVAPLLLGAGVPSFTLPSPAEPDDGMRLDWTPHVLGGGDVLFDVPIHRARPPMCR